MLRRVEQVAHRAHLDDPAGVHHRQRVAHLGDDAEVVGDEDQRHAGLLLDVLEQVEILGLDGDIEVGGGLVGNDQLGSAGKRDGADDALAHAAAHLMRDSSRMRIAGEGMRTARNSSSTRRRRERPRMPRW